MQSFVLAASAALCLHAFAANPLEDKGRPVAQTAALSPASTVASFVLPGGFSANVVAAEPDVVQPIAHTMDDRGRLWVLDSCRIRPH